MGLQYRSDIDGLRAVAVVPVVLFHAGLGPFVGGYVGVDVFFVISGFLITSVIYEGIESGSFSILEFYDRRVRRILPALFLVLSVSGIATSLILTPTELKEFGQSLVATGVFLSNAYFWRESGYFATAAEEFPLLHTWTLAVEEQFYIAFPIFVLLLAKGGKRAIQLGVVTGLVLSLGLSVLLTSKMPGAAYYLAPFRAWELLIGASLALGMWPRLPGHRAEGLGVLGVVLIGIAVFGFDKTTVFPGSAALVPCLGAALIIYSGQRRDVAGTLGGILGSGPFRFVGRISYSLYLWHWPILVLGALYLWRPLSPIEAVVACSLTFCLAALSWKYVEQPLRRTSGLGATTGKRLAAGGAMMATIAIAGTLLTSTDGLIQRVTPEIARIEEVGSEFGSHAEHCLTRDAELPTVGPCVFGPLAERSGYDTIVWGDSHAYHYFSGLVARGAAAGLTLRQIAKPSCPPLLDAYVVFLPANERLTSECLSFNSKVMEVIKNTPDLRLVVLAAAWSFLTETTELGEGTRRFLTSGQDSLSPEASRARFEASLRSTVETITKLGVPVLILAQVPEFPKSPLQCIVRTKMLGVSSPSCDVDAALVKARMKASTEVIKSIAEAPNVSAFFPTDILCGSRCIAFRSGELLYRNHDHLSEKGSLYIGEYINLTEPLLSHRL